MDHFDDLPPSLVLMQKTVAFTCKLCDPAAGSDSVFLRIRGAPWSSTDICNMGMNPKNDLTTTTTSTWASQVALQQEVIMSLLGEGSLYYNQKTRIALPFSEPLFKVVTPYFLGTHPI